MVSRQNVWFEKDPPVHLVHHSSTVTQCDAALHSKKTILQIFLCWFVHLRSFKWTKPMLGLVTAAPDVDIDTDWDVSACVTIVWGQQENEGLRGNNTNVITLTHLTAIHSFISRLNLRGRHSPPNTTPNPPHQSDRCNCFPNVHCTNNLITAPPRHHATRSRLQGNVAVESANEAIHPDRERLK